MKPRNRGFSTRWKTLVLAGVASLALAAAAWGSADSKTSKASPGALPKSGEVVFFGISQQNPYIKQWHLGARNQAKKYGWSLRYVESQNSQQQQDTQITQLLGSGKKPLGIVLSPFAGEAAAASMLAIKRARIPLVIIDAEPSAEQAQLYDIYAGADDVLSARTSAQLLVTEARQKKTKLAGGLIIGCPWDYRGCVRRRDNFPKALAKLDKSAKIVRAYPTKGFGPTEGYDVATQVVPAMKGKFNFVYTLNDAIGLGVIKALKENGLKPGKDVFVVGGTCLGRATNKAVLTGELAGTAVQSPFVEGQLTVITLAQYLNNGGKVTPGRTNVAAGKPPSLNQPPHKFNYMPNPAVENNAAGFQTAKIWGQTAKQLCSYTG
jgi:ABC-type sugar transport system substrate-binding protein